MADFDDSGFVMTDEVVLNLELDNARDALKANLMAMRKPERGDRRPGEPDHALQFADRILREVWAVPGRGKIARDQTLEFRTALKQRLVDALKLIEVLGVTDARLPPQAQ
jgi:hypothetical protein